MSLVYLSFKPNNYWSDLLTKSFSISSSAWMHHRGCLALGLRQHLDEVRNVCGALPWKNKWQWLKNRVPNNPQEWALWKTIHLWGLIILSHSQITSGRLTYSHWKWTCTVDFSHQLSWIFHTYLGLPEGEIHTKQSMVEIQKKTRQVKHGEAVKLCYVIKEN